MSLIFDIKRYSVNDGPGIRITIFLKGCPLSCLWCHNPEGISPHRQKLFTAARCIGCGACISACKAMAISPSPGGMKTDAGICSLCGECIEACPSKAMEMSGYTYSIDMIMKEIRKERVFFEQSGGGVTFCGGEPLMQPAFLYKLLSRCREEDIHTTVDTTLHTTPKILRTILPVTSLFLVDLKMIDPERHRRFCGVNNNYILRNIRLLDDENHPFLIRIPLIENVNADEDNIRATASFLSTLHYSDAVHLLPYHDIGKGKHDKLGSVYNPENIPMATPTDDKISFIRDIFRQYGIKTIVGG
jgi:pyruvate formate lyase activating enzyme